MMARCAWPARMALRVCAACARPQRGPEMDDTRSASRRHPVLEGKDDEASPQKGSVESGEGWLATASLPSRARGEIGAFAQRGQRRAERHVRHDPEGRNAPMADKEGEAGPVARGTMRGWRRARSSGTQRGVVIAISRLPAGMDSRPFPRARAIGEEPILRRASRQDGLAERGRGAPPTLTSRWIGWGRTRRAPV